LFWSECTTIVVITGNWHKLSISYHGPGTGHSNLPLGLLWHFGFKESRLAYGANHDMLHLAMEMVRLGGFIRLAWDTSQAGAESLSMSRASVTIISLLSLISASMVVGGMITVASGIEAQHYRECTSTKAIAN
jgi:hypothetical protein